MSERFTLDRPSFEKVLCATSLIQQLNKQAQANRAVDPGDTKPLSELVETQVAVEAGTINLETAMSRVVGLAVQSSPARGAAIWLFTGDEFVYRAGTEHAGHNERLKLEVLSKLAATCGGNGHSFQEVRPANDGGPAYDAIHYPGSVKSLLVAPIYRDRNIAGALAVFSMEFASFGERDATNARLLAGLLTHALAKAAEAELKQSVSLERAAMLQVIDHLIPALEKLAQEGRLKFHASREEIPSLSIELEPESAAMLDQAQEVPQPEIRDVRREGGESAMTVQMAAEEVEAGVLSVGEVLAGGRADDVSQATDLFEAVVARPSTDDVPSQVVSEFHNKFLRVADGIGKSLLSSAITLKEWSRSRLGGAGHWLAKAKESAQQNVPATFAKYRSLIPVLPRVKVKVRVQYGVAVPGAMLMVLLVVVLWRTMVSYPSKAEGAAAVPSAALAAMAIASGPHQFFSPGSAIPASHRRVTDAGASSSLEVLSRFEVAGLRRRALYGDDTAALVLGLAYESGQLVPQSCAKAREWITRAATEGNAAAQYNLGLRYLQGDGVPVDQEVAAKWIARAAARKYPQALALKSTL